MSDLTLSQHLKAAFLRGEAVVASHFSDEHELSRQGVSNALRGMEKRGLLKSSRVRQSKGGALKRFECIDLAGMQAYKPAVKNATASKREEKGRGIPDLVAAWGIQMPVAQVAGRTHTMGGWE
jgi:hypothetical protein